jgi:hypothetical protein
LISFASSLLAVSIAPCEHISIGDVFMMDIRVGWRVFIDSCVNRNEWLNSKDGRKYTEEMQAKKE